MNTLQPLDLPEVEELRRRMQSLATLDAILSEDWDSRYYSFNAAWDSNQMMGSMRDGSGDEWFCLFKSKSAIILGLAHESAMARPGHPWRGLYATISDLLHDAVEEPAFRTKDKTFCIWRMKSDSSWQRGPVTPPPGEDPDGSLELLGILDGKPETYANWAAGYFEVDVAVEAVAKIYAHEALTPELAALVSADRSFEDLVQDTDEIGYPRP